MAKTRKTDTAEFKLPAFRAQGADAFPSHGRVAPRDEERHRLRAEAQRLKAERDILKKAAADFASHLT